MTAHDCCATDTPKPGGGYDLAVIGAGSAGFSAAITAAELGANVALIGHGTIGGTCTNIGCIALVTVDADTLKALQSNMAGQVSVAAPNNAQPVNIPFSLKGFADGYASLVREHARRTGFFSFLNRA